MNKFKMFSHKECEYYPCHSGYDNKDMNCLWCYCPLQTKKDCPGILDGNAKWLDNNYKDCSQCTFPHDIENYDKMLKEIDDLMKLKE